MVPWRYLWNKLLAQAGHSAAVAGSVTTGAVVITAATVAVATHHNRAVEARPAVVVPAAAAQAPGQVLAQSAIPKHVTQAVTNPAQAGSVGVGSPSPLTPEPIELFLEVRINTIPVPQPVLFLQIEPGNQVLVRGTDLNQWRLYLPSNLPYKYENQDFYALQDIAGLKYSLDMANQTIDITVPAKAFESSVVDGFEAQNPAPQAAPFGGFMNYSLYGLHTSGASNGSAYLEFGLFNSWGVLTSTESGNNVFGSNNATAASATTMQPSKWVRLETTFTQDHPDSATTLKVGDAITNGGMTGLAVRFGGIQYGTNFSTQPYFIPFPLPSYQGSAQLPSTVNVYVNGVLQGSQQVQPGAFSIPQVPTATGPGVMTVSVRNALGQEQVVSVPFYSSTELLRGGLNDYSFSIGKLRNNFGILSSDYGPGLGSVVLRHGFTDSFTGEVRAESTSGESAVSFGGAYGTRDLGVLSGSVASSHSNALGNGAMAELGMQRSGDVVSLGADVRVTNSRFTQLGYFGMPAPKRQATANMGFTLGRAGDLTFAYVNQYLPLIGQQQVATGTYSVNVGKSGYFSLTAFHVLTAPSQSGFVAMFTIPFGERSSASAGVARNNNHLQPFAQVQESLPPGSGMGYHASAELGPNAQTEADVDYQNDVGVYSVGAVNSAGSTLYQASVTGGVGFIGGDWFAARYIPGSFGLVRLPGFPNVPVYDNNLPVAKTDSNGNAILPNLQPYAHNTVSINPSDLPMNAQSDSYNMDAVPYYRSGVVMEFPVKAVKAATFTLHQENGEPVPAGTMLTVAGQSGQFPVGYEGEAYVTGFAGGVKVTAEWDDHRCELILPGATSPDIVPDLGTLVCKEVKTP